jgi:DNA-binding protein H-NS
LNNTPSLRTFADEKEHLEEMAKLSEEIAEAARESQMDLRRECDEYIVRLSEVGIWYIFDQIFLEKQ